MDQYLDLYETRFYRPPEVKTVRNRDPAFIEAYLSKSWIEVQNGLVATMMIFEEGDLRDLKTLQKIILQIIAKLKSLNTWLIECFCCVVDNKICVCSFNPIADSFKNASACALSIERPDFNHYHNLTLLQKAKLLYSLLAHHYQASEKELLIPLLRNEASGPVRVLAALAAEILLVWGEPCVPQQFIYSDNQVLCHLKDKSANAFVDEIFEDRINVGAYNYFELVHPSYARQSVALVNQVEKAQERGAPADHTDACLDVGTGPGAALLMQNELLPNYHFTAIEPSPAAFQYLTQNVAQYANIKALNENFLQYQPDQTYQIILSTGASHHLNTYAFFNKAYELLADNGRLIVADEMISPYSTHIQRKLNIMIHHSHYILELMIRLRTITMQDFHHKEKLLCNLFLNYLPIAYVYAKLSFVNEAEQIYKNLLHQVNKLELDMNVSSPLVAFYRLMHLELEALVAGLDYEVEQKTYPDMFIRMANFAKLKCIYHECVHNTSGLGDKYSGTHVFAFSH